MEKIRDIIKDEILKDKSLNEELVETALIKIEKISIKELNLFSKYIYNKLIENRILYLKDFFNLEQKEARKILKINETTANSCIITAALKIKKALLMQIIKQKTKEEAAQAHKKIIIIIENIKSDSKILDILKKEILYQENYNDLEQEEKNQTKPFNYCKLELNNYELSLLKIYLLNSKFQEKNIQFYDSIINIYNNLYFFIKKLEYKEIINKNYYNLEEINIPNKDIRILSRYNIKYVSELIELFNTKIKFKGISEPAKKRIKQELKEKNIDIPKNLEELEITLNKDNAGIKTKSKIVK